MEKATITVEEASKRLQEIGMRISPTIVRDGMAQGQFPFGSYIKTEKSCVCFVYPKLLEKWIAERFDGERDANPANR